MMRHHRTRTLGVLVGLGFALLLSEAGCLRTLDASLIGQNADAAAGGSGGSSGGSAGVSGNGGNGGSGANGGSAGADASAGSGGSAGEDGGGTGGSAGGGGTGGLPDAGFTAYDASKHPVKNLSPSTPPIAFVADNANVYRVAKGDPNPNTIVGTPIDGMGASTPVTDPDVTRAMALAAPTGSLFLYYVGGLSGTGEIARYLKVPGTSGNPKNTIQGDANTEQYVAVAVGDDTNAYATARATAVGRATVVQFSLAASATTAVTLYTSTSGAEQSGDVTESKGCVYWISNGAIWVISTSGASVVRNSALATPITDAVGLASDASNLYYTRKNGEVWQRQLSPKPACDGSGPPEKPIAGGYTNIGDVIAYPDTVSGKPTVAWNARGDSTNGYSGGGIFTTPAGGYDVTQIAPAADGVDQISDAGLYVAYVTLNGNIRQVKK